MLDGNKTRPEIVLIAAASLNGVIGPPQVLRWKILDRSPNFRRHINGQTVIMGRKTREFLGMPIYGSRNIVLTNSAKYSAINAEPAHSLEQALQMVRSEEQVFVIGGSQLFNRAFKIADRICLTEVNAVISGKHVFPEIRHTEWIESKRSARQGAVQDLMNFCFVEYVRKPNADITDEENMRSIDDPSHVALGQETNQATDE